MMQTEDHPPAAPTLEDSIRQKLESAPLPLKLAEVKKGLTKPKKVSPKDFEADIRRHLDEAVRVGRAFIYPSGTKGVERFWSRDEKHALREKALETAESAPATIADLKKKAAPVSKADAAFIEGVIRELIADGRLFEHPPKKKAGASLFGTVPPPPPVPPLETAKLKKDVDKLITAAKKLLDKAKAPVEDLIRVLTSRLTTTEPAPTDVPAHTTSPAQTSHQPPVTHSIVEGPEPQPSTPELHTSPGTHAEPVDRARPESADLEDLILAEVEKAPVLSLSDLRHQMPPMYRGDAFNAAVIKLFDERKVVLTADANPDRFTPEERQGYVQDEDGALFTNISRT